MDPDSDAEGIVAGVVEGNPSEDSRSDSDGEEDDGARCGCLALAGWEGLAGVVFELDRVALWGVSAELGRLAVVQALCPQVAPRPVPELARS
eukprot:jgi/Tetstr1/455003/TSEL_041861.t1